MTSLSSSPSIDSIETASTIEDFLEEEYNERKQLKRLSHLKNVFIPHAYRKRMARSGLLGDIILTIENETERNDRIQRILAKHSICIPPQYFQRILQNDLFESLIKVVNDVDCEQEITVVNESKRSYEQSYLSDITCKRLKTSHIHTSTHIVEDVHYLSDEDK
ncbi:hypothetical protein I4U23_017159 [Adineta vaga]|nr:hypothetical protein I4U23_017159 [Adineta vaga]